jgi:DNA mismatch repair protein MutL
MCFERHATSKISNVNDLFKITTKGFRGEALASIAAVSQIELLTRDSSRELGTRILIEATEIKKKEFIQSEIGTKILIKNLFYNVPARRKFLKSDIVEFKHITDEFIRVALAHPNIGFSLFHNGNIIYQLARSNLKQRILGIMNKGFEKKLYPIDENLELFSLNGFIGGIDLMQKSRANQFLFVNNRYTKSNYLNHAVSSAYAEFNPDNDNPVFILFLNIDPAQIDINIHPTKQEIKFEEEKLIYSYLKVAVKHVIGKTIMAPKIEFDQNKFIDNIVDKEQHETKTTFNFGSKLNTDSKIPQQRQNWEGIYEIVRSRTDFHEDLSQPILKRDDNFNPTDTFGINTLKEFDYGEFWLLFDKYLLLKYGEKIKVIVLKKALERIYFDNLMNSDGLKPYREIQKLIFPFEMELEDENNVLINEFIDEIRNLNFKAEKTGNKLHITELPAIFDISVLPDLLKDSLNLYLSDIDFRYTFKEKFVLSSLKRQNFSKFGKSKEELKVIIEELFNAKNPSIAPDGSKIIVEIDEQMLKKIINI